MLVSIKDVNEILKDYVRNEIISKMDFGGGSIGGMAKFAMGCLVRTDGLLDKYLKMLITEDGMHYSLPSRQAALESLEDAGDQIIIPIKVFNSEINIKLGKSDLERIYNSLMSKEVKKS